VAGHGGQDAHSSTTSAIVDGEVARYRGARSSRKEPSTGTSRSTVLVYSPAAKRPEKKAQVPHQYYPVFVLVILAAGLVGLILTLPGLIGPRRVVPAKFVPYESGIRPVAPARQRFHVRFSMIAMLFILFDIEVVFFYPWAVNFRQLRVFGLIEMLIFIAILLVGYVYVWRRGAFRWE
jgi:NADH-quinone oxidoreductase subunit A